jgi:type II secretory ATPase GspE/PulE/Tfp pilus assembly ATPase PilB-like protein
MTDFPSINDLQGPVTPAGQPEDDEEGSEDTAQVRLSQTMKDIGLKEKEEATKKQAATLGLPYIDLAAFPVPAEALRVVTEKTAKEKRLVCFFSTPEELRIGVIEPTKDLEEFVYQLAERHHAEVGVFLISEHSWERVMKLYLNLPIVKPVTKEINISDAELNKYGESLDSLEKVHEAFKKISITDVVILMISAALKLSSSDIHVEAEEKGITVRYRIDGVLHNVATLPKEQWRKFISRIKLLAALKINVVDRPQDGRVTLKLSKDSLDVRVSTIPTAFGESVVMRILYSGMEQVSFDDLGLRGIAFEHLKREMQRPNGMIITTGPTGSGKTTTMYAILRTLNKTDVKIITMEDPIEIKVEGVIQSQVDPDKGYTFAKGLRSILRQDPDICMVGEIRDLETAEISVQAALSHAFHYPYR